MKNDSEIRRLVLAKALYLHGCTHASRKDSVSRMLAIHHFDNAMEIILKCLATKDRIEPKGRYFSFVGLLNEVKSLPLKQQIQGLHAIRNTVQHQGDIPSIDTVVKYKGYTEDFFRQVCIERFELPYDKLYISNLIDNETLRTKLMKAEESFEKRQYRSCITTCDHALITAVFEEADVFFSAGVLTGYWGASEELKMVLKDDYPEKYRDRDFYLLAKELRGAILQWGQAATGMQFLGEHRMNFLKHRRIVHTMHELSENELRENAEFSLYFVIDLLLQWQEQGLIGQKEV